MTKNTLQSNGITDEMIAAFLAEKAKKEAAEKAKADKAKAAKQGSSSGDYHAKKKALTAELQTEYKGLLFHFATVEKDVSGLTKGETVEVIWIGANRFLKPAARLIRKDGTDGWCNPANLKPGKALPDSRKAALEAEREAESSATLTIPVTVLKEQIGEGENGGFIVMKYHDFAMPMRIARKLVATVGTIEDGRVVVEVPVWFVKQRYGDFAVTALEARQAEYTALAE